MRRYCIRTFGAIAALSCVCAAAMAQTAVYRCGPEGREYSSTPCASGKPVSVDDSRSADQRRQAEDVHQRDSALADKLAAERRQRETAKVVTVPARLSAAASSPAAAASKPKATQRKRKAKHGDDPRLSPPIKAASAPR